MIKKFFTIDWNRWLLMLLPPILRKQRQASWLQVLHTPLATLYQDLLYKMQHTGQVLYLEKVLNERYNPTKDFLAILSGYDTPMTTQQKANEGLIFLSESYRPSPQYLYLHQETQTGRSPLYVYLNDTVLDSEREYNYFLSLSGETDYLNLEHFNFTINIPDCIQHEYDRAVRIAESTLSGEGLIQKKIQLKNTLLNYTSDSTRPDIINAIYVNTPRFHDAVNYYRIAAKSYETRSYNYHSFNGSCPDWSSGSGGIGLNLLD